ncbi:MAG: zf-HC2 domain-containing protein [Gammaproteobacteria bacterium]|nr:zf-HC2 domain-containing protein [Gammaproteobacteria bacterium]
MLTCKQATERISKQQDIKLTVSEKLSLRFHLLLCKGCKNYQRQINIIHQACQRLTDFDKNS